MPVVGTSPVFEIIHRQLMHGQAIVNVYYYALQAGELSDNIPNLLQGFADNVVAQVEAVQSEDVLHIELEAKRLNDLDEFGVLDLTPITGDITASAPLPIFNAGSIKLLRSTKITKSGSKRIAGIVEAHVDDDVINATGETAWLALAAELGSSYSEGGQTFYPVIVGGKTLDGVPVGEGSWIYNFVSGGQLNYNVTTQNSRKIGRGI